MTDVDNFLPETPHCSMDGIRPGVTVVVGVPFDEYSSFLKGAASAPQHIRAALRSPASNMCTEDGADLEGEARFLDCGDLDVKHYPEDIENPVSRMLERGASIVSLGGDHSITYPIVRGFGQKYPDLTILQLDAHPDLYREFDGNPYSNACPFARIMEEKRARRLVQVGIRTMNPHQQEQAEKLGVETIRMKDGERAFALDLKGPVYISLDLDVLDPAFAPGVSHHEAGGFSTRDVLRIIRNIRGPVVGADIVELNPRRDKTGITAAVAAKLLKEIAGKILYPAT